MYPYKIQLVQSLQLLDMRQWLTHAVKFQEIAKNDIKFIYNLIMGDKAYIHLNGHVNKQNMRFWGTDNPRIAHVSELHPCKVTVWCVVTSERIIGSYFFEDSDENAVVSINKSPTIQQLKANIQTEIHSIQPQMLKTIMENALKRAGVCKAKYYVIYTTIFSILKSK